MALATALFKEGELPLAHSAKFAEMPLSIFIAHFRVWVFRLSINPLKK